MSIDLEQPCPDCGAPMRDHMVGGPFHPAPLKTAKMPDLIRDEDRRPQRRGWAPGGYICKCRACEKQFTGDKRAMMCADCAYAPITIEELMDAWDRLNTAAKAMMTAQAENMTEAVHRLNATRSSMEWFMQEFAKQPAQSAA